MNHIAKLTISEKLQKALKEEGVTKRQLTELSGISATYLSQMSNVDYFSNVAIKVWESVRRWTNSGESLTEYNWLNEPPSIDRKEAEEVCRFIELEKQAVEIIKEAVTRRIKVEVNIFVDGELIR